MKYLYKYSPAAFPYGDLVGTDRRPPWGYHVFKVTPR